MQRHSSHHHNLIGVLRRRLGLTQGDVAFLLRDYRDSYVSKLEGGSRAPDLFNALVAELVFQMPAGRIFGGLRNRARRHLTRRIALLLAKVRRSPATPRRSQRKAQLTRILASIQKRDTRELAIKDP